MFREQDQGGDRRLRRAPAREVARDVHRAALPCRRQTWWTSEVFTAFDRLEQGNENAMKEYYQQCLQGLVLYATMVLGEIRLPPPPLRASLVSTLN